MNAADEKSPGTSNRSPRSDDAGWTVIRRTGPPPAVGIVRSSSLAIRAPHARSMRSVWSRVVAGSVTCVSPAASRPAKSTQDFTWALATGIR
jgi:hypothetical protein